MVLKFNQNKIEYAVVTKGPGDHSHLVVQEYTFRQITVFKCNGNNMNNRSNSHTAFLLQVLTYALEIWLTTKRKNVNVREKYTSEDL